MALLTASSPHIIYCCCSLCCSAACPAASSLLPHPSPKINRSGLISSGPGIPGQEPNFARISRESPAATCVLLKGRRRNLLPKIVARPVRLRQLPPPRLPWRIRLWRRTPSRLTKVSLRIRVNSKSKRSMQSSRKKKAALPRGRTAAFVTGASSHTRRKRKRCFLYRILSPSRSWCRALLESSLSEQQ